MQVQRVAFETGGSAREFVGVVRARYETDLGFRVAGKIVTRVVNVGDRVRAGDVIARLDPQDLELQVESAEAELAAATSNLVAGRGRPRALHHAEGRGLRLDRRLRPQEGGERRGRGPARSAPSARSTSPAMQLGYADLKADADGVITATLAEPGQVVAIGQAVARLAHRGEKEAVVALPETGSARRARPRRRSAVVGARPRFEARLRELSPQADATTRTYAARFTILDADDASPSA